MTSPVLRPLSLGELLDVSFGLYRTLFLPLLIVTVATRAVPLVLSVYVESAGGILASPILYLLSLFLNAVLGAIAAAASTFIISESYLGRRLSAADAFRRSMPFVGRLIMLAIVLSFVVGLGVLLFIIPGVILFAGLAVATPALVLENLPGAIDAMGRSWALTRNHRLKLFAALLVVGLLLYLPFLALGGFAAASLASGTHPGTGALGWFLGLTALAAILSTLIFPLFYAVLTVAYYDLRVRKEAFDLEVLAAGLSHA